MKSDDPIASPYPACLASVQPNRAALITYAHMALILQLCCPSFSVHHEQTRQIPTTQGTEGTMALTAKLEPLFFTPLTPPSVTLELD